MALIDRFLREARIGLDAELVVGPKEIIGTITALDAETVTIRQRNGKTAVADLSAIACYPLAINFIWRKLNIILHFMIYIII